MRGFRGRDLITDERLARLAWCCISEPETPTTRDWIVARGASGSFRALLEGELVADGRYDARLQALDLEGAARALEKHQVRIVIPSDPEWPQQVDDLAVPPVALYVKGAAHLGDLLEESIALGGSRAATSYGLRVATEMASGLADRGVTVVSGAAFGIDAAAHRGALAVDAPTVAVLACGLDRPYPAAHTGLIAQIGQTGAVVSELPAGFAPQRQRFLSRNRLIAALTVGTVVVEANLRSGSLNTAKHARDHLRHHAMVPGPVTSQMSAGCHEWIRVHGSNLVTNARDVLDVMGRLGVDVSDLRRAPETVIDGLSETDRAVWASVPIRGGAGLDALARATGMAAMPLMSSLGRLGVHGLVLREGDKWRRPTPRRKAPMAQAEA